VEKKTDTYLGIELARIYSAIMIVWFHGGGSYPSFSLSGLVIFLLLVPFMTFNSLKRRSKNNVIKSRIKRLLFPWFFWSLIFICLKVSSSFLVGDSFFSRLFPYMLFTGGSIHLWFLMFSFCVVLICVIISSFGMGEISFSIILALLFPVLYFCLLAHDSGKYSTPFSQILFSIPSFFIAFVLYWLYESICIFWFLIVTLVFILFLVVWSYFIQSTMLEAYIIGSIVFILSILYKRKASELLVLCGGAMYGVYILHPAFYSYIKYVWGSLGETESFSFPVFFLVLMLSFFTTILVKKTKLKQFL